jgi:methane/ammonia monooxygenase subunit C
MAQPITQVPDVQAPAVEEDLGEGLDAKRYGPISWWGGWRTCWVGCLSFLLVAVVIRIWQQFTALNAGLDSSSRAFSTQYRTLFIAEVLAVTVGTVAWWSLLVRKGREVVKREATAPEEVRRIAVFWGLVGTTSVILYIAASFFPNQDGAWHQTLIRDTALTPNHIPMFFLFFPLATTITVGTYLYGRYWIPKVYGAEKGFPWSFFLLIAAAVTEMSQVAMNEWGHSLWITEEIFAVPFHWPFVWYGWLAAGIFALWAETIIRLLQIENEIEEPAELQQAEVA